MEEGFETSRRNLLFQINEDVESRTPCDSPRNPNLLNGEDDIFAGHMHMGAAPCASGELVDSELKTLMIKINETIRECGRDDCAASAMVKNQCQELEDIAKTVATDCTSAKSQEIEYSYGNTWY